jgi:transcriptional regulator with XRE-family HTH domain
MTAVLERPVPEGMTFARRFKELTAGETQQQVARRLGYTTGRIGQVQRGEKPSREFVERLVEAYALDRGEWLDLAGLNRHGPEPENERESRIARLAAELAVEEAVRRLLGDPRMETLEQEFLRRVMELQERYGVTPRLFLDGGPGGLTRERLESSLAVIERRMAEEAKQSTKDD